MTSPDDPLDVSAALGRGSTSFMGLELEASPGALVARPETELLGQEALRVLATLGGRGRVIDVCCGSGNLACALAASAARPTVWATDLTEPCVALTRRNAGRHHLTITVVQGDLFAGLDAATLHGTIDVIVCNPPYISTRKLDTERAELLAHEPREAFDGGPYGLSIHTRVIKEALPFLRPAGTLLMEFGLGQDRQVRQLLERSKTYRDIRFVNNQAGAPRVVVATRL